MRVARTLGRIATDKNKAIAGLKPRALFAGVLELVGCCGGARGDALLKRLYLKSVAARHFNAWFSFHPHFGTPFFCETLGWPYMQQRLCQTRRNQFVRIFRLILSCDPGSGMRALLVL